MHGTEVTACSYMTDNYLYQHQLRDGFRQLQMFSKEFQRKLKKKIGIKGEACLHQIVGVDKPHCFCLEMSPYVTRFRGSIQFGKFL